MIVIVMDQHYFRGIMNSMDTCKRYPLTSELAVHGTNTFFVDENSQLTSIQKWTTSVLTLGKSYGVGNKGTPYVWDHLLFQST